MEVWEKRERLEANRGRIQILSLPTSFWARLSRGLLRQRFYIASSMQLGLSPWLIKTSQKMWVMIRIQMGAILLDQYLPRTGVQVSSSFELHLSRVSRLWESLGV